MLAAALNCYFPAVGGQADLHINKQEGLGRGTGTTNVVDSAEIQRVVETHLKDNAALVDLFSFFLCFKLVFADLYYCLLHCV